MGELAKSWTLGFQAPRPSLLNSSVELLQGIITLKHMAVNSLENTAPWTRHSIDANEALGVDPYVLADYYLRPFKSAIRGADARGVMWYAKPHVVGLLSARFIRFTFCLALCCGITSMHPWL
jgi:beta-glucosidase-like glycosyl hydrolase